MIPALILAAGAGRRMGGPKALLVIEGESLLRRAARAALAAGCGPVVAVVGAWDPGLQGLAVHAVPNPDAAEGMASSIRVGMAALPAGTEAVLILAVDQPAVDADLLRRLLALAAADPSRPAACAYAGTLGVPAVLPRRLFPELMGLQGDRGAKGILLREGAASLPFPGGEADLDTPGDLGR
ncbi:nucleotidyltransferase family protein [Geothrix sp. 21YS21S-4]|uniref:nucleotidyltransferase family protein n=1 Tax=Geothrix sp. 21YS21S-4 TaxID=3068889 RepID=UPI0027B90841|nr:nucleotidyltransferase family protein [Geothrix sp. 21YS21S-4]